MLRNGLNISSHSVCKMSNVLRTFENRLCEVIFKRFLNGIISSRIRQINTHHRAVYN